MTWTLSCILQLNAQYWAMSWQVWKVCRYKLKGYAPLNRSTLAIKQHVAKWVSVLPSFLSILLFSLVVFGPLLAIGFLVAHDVWTGGSPVVRSGPRF